MERYRNKYRGDSIRLKNWDYGSPGYYYVTICTKDRRNYFGDVTIQDGIDYRNDPLGGKGGGIVGTHNYASLPPAAHPAHVSGLLDPGSNVTVQLTPFGKIVFENWIDIPQHFPFVSLDEFVVMPNHLHGILCFQKPGYRERSANAFGPQSKNLGSVIRNYKGATMAYATAHKIEFEWQARYHDDVITSRKELDNIRAYIRHNPKRWIENRK